MSLGKLHLNRRTLLTAGISLASIAVTRKFARAGEVVKESGLSYEGLLKDLPGFQPRKLAPLPAESLPGFLSKAQLAETYSVYRKAFSDLTAAEQALQSVSRSPASADEYMKLRTTQVAAANTVLLHELYFRNLALAPPAPARYIVANMSEHMGTLAGWRDDFAACARVASGWAVLMYDPYDDRWHNDPLDESGSAGWIGANPLIVCCVADSAWKIDYKDRESFVAQFFKHIDWEEVAARYRAVDRR